ncbi:MAG: hypothetical protein MUC95_06430 [Spirochaetes bacterium]|jgi:hypothetical protein|nr:hypothetical protein [Spirochaetota bacterium]
MQKHEFAEIFKLTKEDVQRMVDLSRKAQNLGLSAEPEVGLFFLTDMPVNCGSHDVFFVIDNMLYDQHTGAEPGRSPLGEMTYVPDWDAAYAWAHGHGWRLKSAVHDETGITITLGNGDRIVNGKSNSGRLAMIEAVVQAVESEKSKAVK